MRLPPEVEAMPPIEMMLAFYKAGLNGYLESLAEGAAEGAEMEAGSATEALEAAGKIAAGDPSRLLPFGRAAREASARARAEGRPEAAVRIATEAERVIAAAAGERPGGVCRT